MGKIIKMKDLLKKEGIELGKVYTDKTMPPFKVEEKLTERMNINTHKVKRAYNNVLKYMRKEVKKLNDDEMYEVTTQLKRWFNKNIM